MQQESTQGTEFNLFIWIILQLANQFLIIPGLGSHIRKVREQIVANSYDLEVIEEWRC